MTDEKKEAMQELLELIPKADAGDEQAMLDAVNTIAINELIGKDGSTGLNGMYAAYLKKLAESESTIAYIMLGDCYARGVGVEQDSAEAIHWYQRAADAGENFGYECIAMMYYEGRGLAVDYKQAFNYFSKQEKKSACSLYTLGEMYRLGQYVKQDMETARMYYEKIVYSDDPLKTMDMYYAKACVRLGISPKDVPDEDNADISARDESGENTFDGTEGQIEAGEDDDIVEPDNASNDDAAENLFVEQDEGSIPIIGFWHEYDEYGCFSNWYQAEFEYAGKRYTNSEQFMMYHKVMLFHQYEIANQIMSTSDPAKCKKIAGQHFDGFDAELWEKVCYRIVKRGVGAKFKQNPKLLEILLGTDNAILAECSPYDKKWGIGLDMSGDDYLDAENWRGKNYLGRILMEVRSELYYESMFTDEPNPVYQDAVDAPAIPEWNMRAGDLKMIPAYYDAIHTYADTLQDKYIRRQFYYRATLKDWEEAMRTNMGGGLPVIGFYEMKQDVYETAYRLGL